MFRCNELVLTDGVCELLENLRLALEVLTGKTVRFKRIKLRRPFRSGDCVIYLGQRRDIVCISLYGAKEKEITFSTEVTGITIWHIAHFEDAGVIRLFSTGHPLIKGDDRSIQIVGRSAKDRWEEPLK